MNVPHNYQIHPKNKSNIDYVSIVQQVILGLHREK